MVTADHSEDPAQGDLAHRRREYAGRPLDLATAGADPHGLFDEWMGEALESEADDPTAMTLSTSDGKRIASRIVLLKRYSRDAGFVFFGNYNSRKGRDLEFNPQAALHFFWPDLTRQIRIEGRVSRISAAESREYFYSRPYESQIAAVISAQSTVIAGREVLSAEFEALKNSLNQEEVPFPPFWGGWALRPDYFEFWQGRENRLHDRIAYSPVQDGWEAVRLAP